MSESIFETFTDERGNISVRISQEVQVLTREEANRIEAEYRRMQAENAKLRESVKRLMTQRDERLAKAEAENAKLRELLLDVWNDAMQFDGFWDYVNDDGEIYNEDELPHYYDRMRELGLEVK